MAARRVGTVTHYFDRIGVAVIELSKPLKVGDWVQFMGRTTEFEQRVTSLQVNHQNIEGGNAGDEVAMKVIEQVRPKDGVFLASKEEA
jgi:translation elongation factor EF-1alpha